MATDRPAQIRVMREGGQVLLDGVRRVGFDTTPNTTTGASLSWRESRGPST